MHNRGDHLLEYIASRGRISWQAYNRAFDLLSEKAISSDSEPASFLRYHAVRSADSLCYFETSAMFQPGIHSNPVVLARLPYHGRAVAFLTGSRRLSFLDSVQRKLREFDGTVTLQQHDHKITLPTSILLREFAPDQLQSFADALNVRYIARPVSQDYLTFSADLQSIFKRLSWTLSSVKVQKRFDPDTDRPHFNNTRLSNELELIRVTSNGQIRHFLSRSSHIADVDPDWGRFMILSTRKRDILSYDRRAQILSTPAAARLPKILERAACMCSGMSAVIEREQNGHAILRYNGVPAHVAGVIASKLGQKLKSNY